MWGGSDGVYNILCSTRPTYYPFGSKSDPSLGVTFRQKYIALFKFRVSARLSRAY